MSSINSDEIISILKEEIENFDSVSKDSEVGTVVAVGDGIATIYGIDHAMYGEIVTFDTGLKGMVQDIQKNEILYNNDFFENNNFYGEKINENDKNLIIEILNSMANLENLGNAVKILTKEEKKEIEHSQKLKEKLADKISKEITDIKLNSVLNPEKSSPKVLNVSFNKTKGEVLTHFLGMHQIYVSTGSACSSKKGNSRILEVMGLSQMEMDGAIRFSFSKDNTEDEIDEVVERLKEIVERIRKMR